MNRNVSKMRKIFLCVIIALLAGTINHVSAQIPADMEKDMDNLNALFYKALKIIDVESEQEALNQLALIKPKIEAKVKAYADKWVGTELSDEDEITLGKKMLEKQLYKDMYALLGNPSFMSKIESSKALKNEYDVIMGYLDDEEEETTTSLPLSGSSVLSFSVNGAVPYAGNYSVKANSEQAFAHLDENNLFAVDISSTLNGGEFQFIILAEEAKTGTYKWTMESQILIQSWDDEQNERIKLSSYYNEGTITFDKTEGVGGKVTGSFKGKFFDDTQATDQPVNVTGSFSVTRIKNVY